MKALFVGLGGIGQRHLRNLMELDRGDLEVHAFRERRLDEVVSGSLDSFTGESLESKYSIVLHGSFEAGLRNQPDLVVVSNPTNRHLWFLSEAIQAGVPVLVEKPVASDWKGVALTVAHAEAHGRAVFVGYQLRFHPCVERMFDLVLRGSLGNIVSVQMTIGEYLPGWHTYEDYRQMYAARADLGGGVVLSQIHEFDLLVKMFGSPESVTAVGGRLSDLEIDVEDTVISLFKFVSDGRTIPVSVNQDFVQAPARREYRIVGTEGKIEVNMVGSTLDLYDRHGGLIERLEFPGFDRNEMFRDQLLEILGSLDGHPARVATIREGAESLRMALSVLRSLAEDREVMIREFDL